MILTKNKNKPNHAGSIVDSEHLISLIGKYQSKSEHVYLHGINENLRKCTLDDLQQLSTYIMTVAIKAQRSLSYYQLSSHPGFNFRSSLQFLLAQSIHNLPMYHGNREKLIMEIPDFINLVGAVRQMACDYNLETKKTWLFGELFDETRTIFERFPEVFSKEWIEEFLY